jgi:hypothetical protein
VPADSKTSKCFVFLEFDEKIINYHLTSFSAIFNPNALLVAFQNGFVSVSHFPHFVNLVFSTAPPPTTEHFSSSEIPGKGIQALGGADALRAINGISYKRILNLLVFTVLSLWRGVKLPAFLTRVLLLPALRRSPTIFQEIPQK